MNGLRTLRGAIAAAVAAMALPAGASAAQLGHDGSVLTYTAGPGEANSVTLSIVPYENLCEPLAAPCLSLSDTGARIDHPAGVCKKDSSGGFFGDEVKCAMPSSVVAHLGDGDDAFWDWPGPSTVSAGPGNDNPIEGLAGNDVLRGEGGTDNLTGGAGDDGLDGGPGDDFLEGVPGASSDSQRTVGTDTYVGGGGNDTLAYNGRDDGLSLSADGVPDDGAPGERDNIGADIMTIVGGAGPDRMVGGAGRNVLTGDAGDDEIIGGDGDDQLVGGTGNDRMAGEGGQDVLGGGDGDDRLDGGDGVDRFWGDEVGACIARGCASGQDVIRARDGAAEEINCGAGTDTAEVDADDKVFDSANVSDQCEHVDRAGAAGTQQPSGTQPGAAAPALLRASRAAVRRNRVALRLHAPGPGIFTVTARARVRGGRARAVAAARRRTIRVGRASIVARRAGPVTVRLRVSRVARRHLARRRRLVATFDVRFQPGDGGAVVRQRRAVTLRRG